MSETKKFKRWPLGFIAAPAAVAVWSGWVGLGGMSGFGPIHPFPGIPRLDHFVLNTAITLPIGVEAYGAYAMGAWLTPGTSPNVKRFARRSAIGSLLLGMLGQVAYHLLSAKHATHAPWPIVMLVACLPVVALGFGAALAHLLRNQEEEAAPQFQETSDGFPSLAYEPVAPTMLAPPDLQPPAATRVREPKPEPVVPRPTTSHRQRARHAPGAPTVEAVENEFREEIGRGEIPNLPTIRRRLRVGDSKARSYQAHIAEKGRAVRDTRVVA